jgi:hypothetical protein
MLVVLTIIVFLAAVLIVLGNTFTEENRAGKGADMLQGWLLNAKQAALKTGTPRGLRAVIDPQSPPDTEFGLPNAFVRQFLYIEQPPDYLVPGTGTPAVTQLYLPTPSGTLKDPINNTPLPNSPVALLSNPTAGNDFTGGITGTQAQSDPNWAVQVGDYLEIQGGGLLMRIVTVNPGSLVLSSEPLAPSPPLASGNIVDATYQYRIIRRPRVLTGETPLNLPDKVAVHTPGTLPPPSTTGTPDILFTPAGRVLGPAPNNAPNVTYWVCDVSQDPSITALGAGKNRTRYLLNGPVLVNVNTGSGFIATYPVDQSGTMANQLFYTFTLDGRSGL